MPTESDPPEGDHKTDEARTEEFSVSGDKLVGEVKRIVREGNARRILVKSEEGKVLMEIPLSFGLFGAVMLPFLAGLGAIAALATRCTIVVERRE
ncbi:MAG: DUF4342 domain-containing protein [Fimbriimonadaceae bacterium]|nr:DUF4342 domain-containing protein [Fimbriimonadaceae bacterium]